MSNLVAGYHPIYCYQRQRLVEKISVEAPEGAWDFAGKTFQMQVREFKKGPLVLDCSTLISVDTPSTSFSLTLTRAVTSSLPTGSWVYDLWVDEMPLLAGPFEVLQSVTQDA